MYSNIERFLKLLKIENFQKKIFCRKFLIFLIFDIFLIFAQNIDCEYMLELPQRGGSNEYPQSMFWSKNKKNSRDVNECQNWYSNIRIGYSNIFEYSNDIHIYAQ